MLYSRARLVEIWRYYQAGIVNTAYGLGAYWLLVRFGLNLYVAQFIAHFTGVAFNYFTYSRYVFHDSDPAKSRFAASYVGNYLIGLTSLAAISHWVGSPYVAGFLSVLLVSIVNYLVLKKLVFRGKAG
jgi:putative flippase GtrA